MIQESVSKHFCHKILVLYIVQSWFMKVCRNILAVSGVMQGLYQLILVYCRDSGVEWRLILALCVGLSEERACLCCWLVSEPANTTHINISGLSQMFLTCSPLFPHDLCSTEATSSSRTKLQTVSCCSGSPQRYIQYMLYINYFRTLNVYISKQH